MPEFSNLISDSILVKETISYLASAGGCASAVRVVDRVMKIRRPEPQLAERLVADLIDRDPRLTMKNGNVEYIDGNARNAGLDESDFVVIDLETTGAKAPPSRVTEIGAYRVRSTGISDEFHSLVNPQMPIPRFITSLTGIDDAMVADAPLFGEIAVQLLEFIGGSVIVAHNARFDLGFLNHEIGRVFEDCRLGNPVLCTVQLSRRLLPEIRNHKLKTVAEHYSIDLVNHHRANEDARATAMIFLNLLAELKARGISDLDSARSFSTRREYARRRKAAT